METKVTRTLVKSAPELWELADDQDRMQIWMARLIGATGPIEIRVTRRTPERALAWQTAGDDDAFGRIALELNEKGFGTAVTITAHQVGGVHDVAAALDNLLDELGSPERQPFVRS
jgi:hypothetical protein